MKLYISMLCLQHHNLVSILKRDKHIQAMKNEYYNWNSTIY